MSKLTNHACSETLRQGTQCQLDNYTDRARDGSLELLDQLEAPQLGVNEFCNHVEHRV
jgi:hypothetical protein